MPIAIDASTPANVQLATSTSATATTASFSPPAKSLVVIHVTIGFDANTPSPPSFTVADSGSTSYTAGPTGYDGGATGVWLFSHYYATAPGAITVTATRTGQLGAAMFFVKTWVLTGSTASQTGAASASAHAQTGTGISGSITPTQPNSWVMVGGASGSNIALNAAGGLTQDTSWADSGDGEATASGHLVVSSVAAQSPGWTVASNIFWSWAALEVLPAVVTLDAVGPSSAGAGGTTSPLTWSHTCGSAATTLYVGAAVGQTSGNDSTFTCTATYNGVAMTALSPGQSMSATGLTGNAGFIKVFKLENPPTGSALTVSVTVSGGTISALTGGSLSVAGAGGGESTLTVGNSSASVTSGSVNIPSTTHGRLCLAFLADGQGGITWTAGTEQYEKDQNTNSGAGNSSGATLDSPGGTATMSWTQTSDGYAIIAFEVQPPAAASPVVFGTTHRPSKSRLRHHQGARRQQIQAAFQSTTPTIFPVVIVTPTTATMDGAVWLWLS